MSSSSTPNNLTVLLDAPAPQAPAVSTAAVQRWSGGSPVAMLFEPRTRAECMNMLVALAGCGMVPRQFQNDPWGIAVCIDAGYRLGYTILQSLQNIAVINGKPSIYGDEMLARVKRADCYEYVRESMTGSLAAGDAEYTCRAKRKGEEEVVRTFSIEDAKRAELWNPPKGGPWRNYPLRMLMMRARGFALRDCFTDVLGGIISREEAEDFPIRDAEGRPTTHPAGRIIDDKLPRSRNREAQLIAVLDALAQAKTPGQLLDAAALARDLPPEFKPRWADAWREAQAIADPQGTVLAQLKPAAKVEASTPASATTEPEQATTSAAPDEPAAEASTPTEPAADTAESPPSPAADEAEPAAEDPGTPAAEALADVALDALRRGLEVCASEAEWIKIRHAYRQAEPRVRGALHDVYNATVRRMDELTAAEDEKWARET